MRSPLHIARWKYEPQPGPQATLPIPRHQQLWVSAPLIANPAPHGPPPAWHAPSRTLHPPGPAPGPVDLCADTSPLTSPRGLDRDCLVARGAATSRHLLGRSAAERCRANRWPPARRAASPALHPPRRRSPLAGPAVARDHEGPIPPGPETSGVRGSGGHPAGGLGLGLPKEGSPNAKRRPGEGPCRAEPAVREANPGRGSLCGE